MENILRLTLSLWVNHVFWKKKQGSDCCLLKNISIIYFIFFLPTRSSQSLLSSCFPSQSGGSWIGRSKSTQIKLARKWKQPSLSRPVSFPLICLFREGNFSFLLCSDCCCFKYPPDSQFTSHRFRHLCSIARLSSWSLSVFFIWCKHGCVVTHTFWHKRRKLAGGWVVIYSFWQREDGQVKQLFITYHVFISLKACDHATKACEF